VIQSAFFFQIKSTTISLAIELGIISFLNMQWNLALYIKYLINEYLARICKKCTH
jgi:hypothetical protein